MPVSASVDADPGDTDLLRRPGTVRHSQKPVVRLVGRRCERYLDGTTRAHRQCRRTLVGHTVHRRRLESNAGDSSRGNAGI